jgi:dienelactone hydrolase
MKTRLLLIALSLLVLAPVAKAQTADYSAFGPFTTSTESNTGPDGTYTIVRPETLGKDGFVHAPIIFGPGIGGPMASMMNLLQRIASHGFVIIGRQLDGGPNNPENNRRMIAGLDWLLAQNTTAGSPFEGKLDVKRAAAMGYSVGGTGAVAIGGHPAITTVISIHGHSAKAALHGTLLLLGGTNDVMKDGQSWLAPTYEASQVQTFFSLVDGANHGYPARSVEGVQSGVEAPAMIAWLRYWIYNDQGARRYFFGDDCVMCTAPWTKTQRKNWP